MPRINVVAIRIVGSIRTNTATLRVFVCIFPRTHTFAQLGSIAHTPFAHVQPSIWNGCMKSTYQHMHAHKSVTRRMSRKKKSSWKRRRRRSSGTSNENHENGKTNQKQNFRGTEQKFKVCVQKKFIFREGKSFFLVTISIILWLKFWILFQFSIDFRLLFKIFLLEFDREISEQNAKRFIGALVSCGWFRVTIKQKTKADTKKGQKEINKSVLSENVKRAFDWQNRKKNIYRNALWNRHAIKVELQSHYYYETQSIWNSCSIRVNLVYSPEQDCVQV